jgi:hypothetical protein
VSQVGQHFYWTGDNINGLREAHTPPVAINFLL